MTSLGDRLSRWTRGSRDSSWLCAALAIAIALVVVAVFGQSARFDLVDWDDPHYLRFIEQRGFDVKWAFTTLAFFNWHPLTWLSLMLDRALFGHHPLAFHRTNVALHAITAVLLFWVMRRTTGSLWRSALIAGLFAWHPLRAESVAWISQRKDVLSGLFFVLTLGAYSWYAVRPALHRYLATLLCCALALMSKPTTVTLPIVLLLFDLWPLRRWQPLGAPDERDAEVGARALQTRVPVPVLLLEKVPFAAAAVLVSGFTLGAQEPVWNDRYPLPNRLANSVLSYVRYLGKAVWPSELSAFYPWGPLGLDVLGLSLLFLAGVTFLVLRTLRTEPWWAVGWLWYLVVLIPMLGIVQVGNQAMADRYTYLALIGPALAVGYGAPGLLQRRGVPPALLSAVAIALLATLAVLCHQQVGTWRSTRTLFTHALDVNERNFQAHAILGETLRAAGEDGAAEVHLRRAVALAPDAWRPATHLAWLLVETGRIAEAEALIAHVLPRAPNAAEPYQVLGMAFARQGRLAAARAAFAHAAEVDPESAGAREQLALVERELAEKQRGPHPPPQLTPDSADPSRETFLLPTPILP